MLESSPSVRVVLTTTANREEASRLGKALVEERLVACATLFPAVESIYSWEGKLETNSETMLMLKTNTHCLGALEARLAQLHSYETPEFLVISVEAGNHAYLAWLHGSLGASK